MRAFALGVLKSLVTTAIVFVAAELVLRGVYSARNAFVRVVPLPYAVGDEYGPIPPWLDRLLLLVPDDALIWHSTPNVHRTYVDIFSPVRRAEDRTALLRRFIPTLPEQFRANPTWTIALNDAGFRNDPFVPKPRDTIRIACVGDSWTFGMNVDQDRTYPARLAAWLATLRPGARYEVENFGVLGYTSFQGRRLLETRVLAMKPDIVAIGFGMNDSEVAGYRDRDMVTASPTGWGTRLKERAADLELYKLLRYAALTAKFHPRPLDAYLKEEDAATGSPADTDYDAIDPWTRVSPRDFERNIRAMVARATASGARTVLLDNELWNESPYRPILKTIAADTHTPLVDSLALVADAKQRVLRDLESRLALATGVRGEPGTRNREPGTGNGEPGTRVVFRVYRGQFEVPRAMSIVGADAQLGSLIPNSVLMHDDGTDGDEHAGDGVWSVAAKFAPGTRVVYMYTNSGERGRWEGLDLPHIRQVIVPASAVGGPVYLPIDTFGKIYMQADNWHTDATGYDLIGRAVAEAIVALRPPSPPGDLRPR